MPTPLNFNGNDDNALEALVIDAGIAFTHCGNTHEAINALAAVVVYDLPFQGNDRQMLEAIAANAVIAPPFVYKLDDDGTLAATIGLIGMNAVAPAYMQASGVIGSSHAESYAAMPESLAQSFDVVPGVMAFEVEIVAAPWSATQTTSYILGGAIVTVDGLGTMLGLVESTFDVEAAGTLLRIADNISVATLPADYAEGKRIGVYINTETGDIAAKDNQADYGVIQTISMEGVAKLAPMLTLAGPTAEIDVTGQTATMKLHVTGGDMLLSYPAGTLDMYGTEI